MAKYKVIKYFTDIQDGNHAYHVGDTFPRAGHAVSEDRLKELSTGENRLGKPLIIEEAPETNENAPKIDSEVEDVKIYKTESKVQKTTVNESSSNRAKKTATGKAKKPATNRKVKKDAD